MAYIKRWRQLEASRRVTERSAFSAGGGCPHEVLQAILEYIGPFRHR